jgi:hypothetical protein
MDCFCDLRNVYVFAGLGFHEDIARHGSEVE